jgi:hypothetical protein
MRTFLDQLSGYYNLKIGSIPQSTIMLNYFLYFPFTASKVFWFQGYELTLQYVPNHSCIWSQISTNCRLRHNRKLSVLLRASSLDRMHPINIWWGVRGQWQYAFGKRYKLAPVLN